MLQKLDVLEYQNYRTFLLDHLDQLRKFDPEFNMSRWARQMGFFNVNSLNLIIKGQRHPGNKTIPKLSKYFEFTDRHEEYFRYLIKCESMKQDELVLPMLKSVIKRMSVFRFAKAVDEKVFSNILDWQSVVIQQLASRMKIPQDTQWLKGKLRFEISDQALQGSLNKLVEQNIIEIKDGHYVSANSALYTSADIPSESIKLHHEQMIENAKKAIRTQDVAAREIHGRTLMVRKSDVEKAKKMIRDFSAQFGAEMDAAFTDTPNEVQPEEMYQLNVQFFSLTNEIENNEKH